ncbi:unnamed protein product [Cochlearia groenlandica]
MGRSPSGDENGIKKGPWTQEEDEKLVDHIQKHGHGSWRALPKQAEEEETIINIHSLLGNKWSSIASNLPGRTDNEIKNYWNTHLRKKLLQMGIDPVTHRPRTDHQNILASLPQLIAAANFNNLSNLNQNIQLDATTLAKAHLLHNMIQILGNNNNNISPSSSKSTMHNNLFDQSSYLEKYQNIFGQSQNFTNILENQIINHPFDSFSSPIQMDVHQDDHNTMPLLVMASTDQETKESNKIIKNKVIANYHDHHHTHDHTSNPSSPNSTFTQDHHQPWSDTIDDEANDSYWKEIIEQTSLEPWLFHE